MEGESKRRQPKWRHEEHEQDVALTQDTKIHKGTNAFKVEPISI